MSARAKAHMPMVLLTLLSILQALALELLWAHVREHDYLTEPTWTAFIAWVQIGTTLLGVLLIWVLYTSMVMRFRWVPSTSDSLYPFLIGILEFVMIAALGPESLGYWFATLGVLFGITTAAMQMVLRRARLDGENDEWFASIAPATLRDFYPSASAVVVLVGFGTALGVTGHRGIFALGGADRCSRRTGLPDVLERRFLVARDECQQSDRRGGRRPITTEH
ncbi:MAG: hypothetical protein O3A63_21900 [Proteobacteria bacterium]|nr:hypothetical protein [Pseudomonadota bacterium]